MLLSERPLDRSHTVGIGEGFEAYRQLHLEYEPRAQSRFVGLLMNLLQFSFDGDIPAKIAEFEGKVKEYTDQSGQGMSDDVLYGILVMGIQGISVKQHLVRNSHRLNTWATAKAEILEIARTQRFLQDNPQPMQISALPKGKDGKMEKERKVTKARRETPKGKTTKEKVERARC